MENKYDAIVIGAGIIGACTGFELAKKGLKVLNVDKLPEAGHGSTSGSCAIIRLYYSTPDGVTMAREGYYYWIDWPKYLGTVDETGLVKYINTGGLVMKTPKNHYLEKVKASLDELNVCYWDFGPREITDLLPILDTRGFGPPTLTSDPRFGTPARDSIAGALYIPEAGLISDPKHATHNVQRAAEARGGRFLFNARVVQIRKKDNQVQGITLANGIEIDAPVVINVAGPHSFQINRMAGVEEEMNIKTRALRQEVCHVPAPEGFDYNHLGTIISDGDVGCYSRPEVGNHILIGSEDPECDTSGSRTCASPTNPAASWTCTTAVTTGFPSMTDPASTDSTWPWAPAATSSRTRPWWGYSWQNWSRRWKMAMTMTKTRCISP